MLSRAVLQKIGIRTVNALPIREYRVGPERTVNETKVKLMQRLSAVFAVEPKKIHENTKSTN